MSQREHSTPSAKSPKSPTADTPSPLLDINDAAAPEERGPLPEGDIPLMKIAQAAAFLAVSISWVRRHLLELPHTRRGRCIRIDGEQLKRTIEAGKSLRPERAIMPRRYQRGSVFFDNKSKQWKGRFRLDMPDGSRVQKKVTIGSKAEYPTKTAARDKLDEIRRSCSERWRVSQCESSPR